MTFVHVLHVFVPNRIWLVLGVTLLTLNTLGKPALETINAEGPTLRKKVERLLLL